MNAIQTEYKGQVYKSKLEARYAMLFDEIGIISTYEPFRIKNGNESYLPDFYTEGLFSDVYIETEHAIYGELMCLIEIKPKMPNKTYLDYLMRVRLPGKLAIIGICGDLFFGNNPLCYFVIDGHSENRLTTDIKLMSCIKCNGLLFHWNDDCGGLNACVCDQRIVGSSNILKAVDIVKDYRFDL